ncbi:MAG TPA: 5'-nucleotidase C-terminal domain-containing protein [Thermoanaerobaculia bacterium]|nr:5'-nucleotidase C-terminal domain-containing protein [Thermoanaerobaculia bacterium]
MRRILLLVLFLALPLRAATTVTLLHFSDYHSHAIPFYTDEGERGGIARTIGYLKAEKRRGALVFSGGDTINKGAPAWSDKYGCAEWSWFNGIVDAMAFGNHDADYGHEEFDKCRAAIRYPILSANTPGFERYRVFTAKGKRIGVFALAGSDFAKLVKTPGFTFGDPVGAAREVVRELREKERVDAIVMIGHEHAEDDYALAKAIPDINLIFGSHSHLKRELTRIPDTQTWYISPSQYLTYISRVELTFGTNSLGVRAQLVPVDARMREDRAIAKRVQQMQQELERDPKYSELFTPIATLAEPLNVAQLAQRTLDVMRNVTQSDVAISTTSSFRQPLPRGTLTLELLLAALPYENEIETCTMVGAQVQQLLDYNASRKGTDDESFVSAPSSLGATKTYRIAVTDFLANMAWKDELQCERQKSGFKVREELRKALTR